MRDEILYREGIALGLDRDDPVIARRVCQKFDLIAEEQSAGGVHSDAHLTAWLAQNPSRFLPAAEGTDSGSRAHSQKIWLPQLAIPVALLCFNVGVEIGQLLFIAAVLALIAVGRAVPRRVAFPHVGWMWHVPPYATGGIASYWVRERVAAF